MSSHIAVLLCTYNGEEFLREQLASLDQQTWPHISLHVSDDGSRDLTPAILRQTADQWTKGSVTLVDGPRKGFAENFRSAVVSVDPDHDYYAFCDQDDLWDEDKLSKAVTHLGHDPAIPQLYAGRTRLIDADGRPVGFSPLFIRPPGFRNAIIQSLAGGNTMVFNRAALQALKKAAANAPFIAHDWWAYQIISGVGGMVSYDPVPYLGYRQHGGNEIGSNSSLGARVSRFKRLLQGTLREWNSVNLAGLNAIRDDLSDDARSVVAQLETIRASGPVKRVITLHRSGIYRQTRGGQAGLYLAAMLGLL